MSHRLQSISCTRSSIYLCQNALWSHFFAGQFRDAFPSSRCKRASLGNLSLIYALRATFSFVRSDKQLFLICDFISETLDRSMLSTLVRRSAAAPKFNIYTNPFKAKRQWPPDFDKISQKHQFRLERRYRRRCKLKWARPRWTKFVKLAQGGSVICMSTFA